MQRAWRKPFKKPSLWPPKDVDNPRKLPPVPSEFSFKLPEESWWLPTQPPMDVSAEQPGLGSSPPGPQLQLHPLPLSRFSLFPLPSFLPFLPSSLLSSPSSSFPPAFPFLLASSFPPLLLSALAGHSRLYLHRLVRRRKKVWERFTSVQGDRGRNEGEQERGRRRKRENKGEVHCEKTVFGAWSVCFGPCTLLMLMRFDTCGVMFCVKLFAAQMKTRCIFDCQGSPPTVTAGFND